MKLFTFFIFATIIIGGAVWFKSSTPTVCAKIDSGDSVFILTGDPRRIPAGVKIHEQIPDAQIYIIGAGGHPMPEDRTVIVEKGSKTTYENAIAIKKIAHAKHLRRIVILTSVDHIKRSELLVRRELPRVDVALCPVPLHGTPAPRRLERWAIEYAKYLGTIIGLHKL